MPTFPEDLKYSTEHEWVRTGNSSTVRVGITDFAAEQLGDIVYVSLPEVGATVAAGDACGELDSTKSVSDVFAPVSGVVSAVNQSLDGAPELLNTDPYGDGWLFEVEVASDNELDDLLDADAYAELTEQGN
ncbi:glycine cleavage system protein GcvH [Microlunatus sp. GCM10028923]|uniref:glycine cleavage system protein GcvH n=1 Tax=Microlunatus sp. GCM10028923 TaxID=3273400 RepID=UPI00360C366E